MPRFRKLSALFGLLALCSAPIASAQTFTATLAGTAENPPNASPGIGTVTVTFADPLLTINATFSALTGNTSAAHIHCCAVTTLNAGVATQTPSFATFPLGVTSGTHTQTLDMDVAGSWNAAFVTASGSIAQAKARLVAAMAIREAYYNIHSSTFGGGEIRGNLVAEALFSDSFE